MDERKDTADDGTVRHPALIDIEKLAEKVYQLLRAELQLARKRGQKRGTRR